LPSVKTQPFCVKAKRLPSSKGLSVVGGLCYVFLVVRLGWFKQWLHKWCKQGL